LTAFLYTTSTEASQFLFYASYCAAMFNHIWLSCYFGQKVINSSERAALGAYASGWEGMRSLRAQKAIMKVIQRAQRPARLTAMNFTDVSLKCITTVSKKVVEVSLSIPVQLLH
jgi:7tm Odorant receptor